MGFAGSQAGFYFRGKRDKSIKQQRVKGLSVSLLHQAQCSVCPLNKCDAQTPHMDPAGAGDPDIYVLGEMPGAEEDKRGTPFVGTFGRVFRTRIPDEWKDRIRFNNVVRTRPPDDREPDQMEIECCRPSVIKDIERTKPRAIFGFGNIPLSWAVPSTTGITRWSFRRLPVKIGNHACWYYPLIHPSTIVKGRRYEPRSPKDVGSEEEFAWVKNLEWAFRDVPRLPEPVVHTREDALADIEIITGEGPNDLDRVLDFIDVCFNKKLVGIDYETNRLRPYSKGAKILTCALSCDEGTMAFGVDHPGTFWADKQRDAILDALEAFTCDSKALKIAHNAVFEIEWSAYMLDLDAARSRWACTQGQAYLLDERQLKCLNLEFLSLQYFGLNIKAIDNTDTTKLEQTPLDIVCRYNAVDAKYHRLLYIEQRQRMKDEGVLDVFPEHMRRVKAAALTGMKGIPVSQEVVEGFVEKYGDRCADVEAEIAQLEVAQEFKKEMGFDYRPGAPKDVMHAFYTMLGFKAEEVSKSAGRRGKKGGKEKGLADEDTLKNINHPLAEKTIEWRKANKVLSTYVLPCLKGEKDSNIFPDGKLHPTLRVDKTKTWRSSSEEPNIQNWPKRDMDTREIRSQVKAPPGYKVVSFDYAGIQARNVAMESKDKTLVDAYWKGYDIHTDWMERILKVYPKWVDQKQLAKDPAFKKNVRNRAKNELVFPSFFGARAKSIAGYLQIPEKYGEALQEEFFDLFHDIKRWHEHLEKFYKKHGYVTGLSGHRRRAPVSPNEMINAPIQADESLIVFDAMSRLSEMGWEFQACLMVHDDLTFIWPTKKVEEYAEIVVKTMLDVPYEWAHIVPMGAEMSIGDDWGTMQGVGEYTSDKWDGIIELKKDK